MNDSLLYNNIKNTNVRISTEINDTNVRADTNSPNSQTNTNISDQSNKNENIVCCLKFACKYFCNIKYWLSFVIFVGIVIIMWVIIDAAMITK